MEKFHEESYSDYLGDYFRIYGIVDFSESDLFYDQAFPPAQPRCH
jgi:hypothetical protein